MTRFLMYISYLGTRFRGIQKQVSRAKPEAEDPFTVQGMLEIALRKFDPVKVPQVVISSRTDRGVHGLRSAIHVDLEHQSGTNYVPTDLVRGLNKYFDRSHIAIRVQECQIVPETFHARFSAIKRSYLYRLAVRKPEAPPLAIGNQDLIAQIPFWDWRRCYFIQNPEFDVEKFRSSARLLLGEKDFCTFIGISNKRNRDGSVKEISTVRVLHSIHISPHQPSIPSDISEPSAHYNYWNIVFCAKSFGYRQVRRMVGVLVAVAQGKLLESDVEHMLANPSPESWKSFVAPAPAYGLYLSNVHYDAADLILENGNVMNETKQEALSLNDHKASGG
ncbi:tRNA pseudouridine synthase [Gryllus bimaculatus]|nr:tRNA pseudouridine synthase [Gryllus bimaculatus]